MAKGPRPANLAFRALQAGVVALVLLTGAGLTGTGPLAWLRKKSDSSTPISAASRAAGRRIVERTVTRGDPQDQQLEITGSLRG